MNIQKQITQLKRAKTAKKNYQSMIKKTKESIEQKEQSQIGLSIPEITEKIIMNKILPEIQNFYENYIAYQKEENPDKTDKEIMDLTFEGIYKDTDKIKQNLEKMIEEKNKTQDIIEKYKKRGIMIPTEKEKGLDEARREMRDDL